MMKEYGRGAQRRGQPNVCSPDNRFLLTYMVQMNLENLYFNFICEFCFFYMNIYIYTYIKFHKHLFFICLWLYLKNYILNKIVLISVSSVTHQHNYSHYKQRTDTETHATTQRDIHTHRHIRILTCTYSHIQSSLQKELGKTG